MHPWISAVPPAGALHFEHLDQLPRLPHSVLENTYIASDDELSAASAVISKVSSDAEECDRLLQHLEATHRLLQRRKAELLQVKKRYVYFASPVRKLPPELLNMIFSFCYDERRQYRWAICTLSRVCKQWCSVMVSIPELWTEFHRPHRFPRDLQRFTTASRCCVSRSGSLPLHIRLEASRHLSEDFPTSQDLSILFSACHRFESLSLTSENMEWNKVVCDAIQRSYMPSLKTLTVASGASSDLNLRTELVPGLERIVLRKHPTITSTSTAWNRVREVALQDMNNVTVFRILQWCTNLSKLALENVNVKIPLRVHQPVQLPVEQLSVSLDEVYNWDMDGRLGQGLLDHLTCPNLSEFSLDTPWIKSDEISSMFERALSGFFYCSSSQLRSLDLPYFRFQKSEIFSILRQVPRARELRLKPRTPIAPAVMKNLFAVLSDSALGLVPELSRLAIFAAISVAEDVQAMLHSRRNVLRSVGITFYKVDERSASRERLEAVEELFQPGLWEGIDLRYSFCRDWNEEQPVNRCARFIS